MREPGEYFAVAFVCLFVVGILAIITYGLIVEPVKNSTSDWWKTEIVRRGYGTRETTSDGQVWFKWKEQEPQETWLRMKPNGTIEEEK